MKVVTSKQLNTLYKETVMKIVKMDLTKVDVQKQIENKIPVNLKAMNVNGRKKNIQYKPGDNI